METLFVLDAHNYEDNMEEIRRVAVRGIIFVEGKLVVIENSFDEVKLPGGGKEPNESDIDTLVREVKEETGYDVIVDSIRPFGEIEEKRLSTQEPKIWHQYSRVYFCEVDKKQGECSYTESEKMYGFRYVLYTLEEAISKNEAMLEREGHQPWNQREYKTLLAIKNYIESEGERRDG